MKSRQNRMNGGIVGGEGYPQLNNMISTSQNYNRNVGSYFADIPLGITYTRPTEWIALPTVTAGDQRLVGAFAVYNNDSNFLAFTVSGNYLVDWGDGTTGAFSSATTAYKRYTTTTYDGLTTSVYRNYKTLLVSITPQAGQTLTSIVLPVKHNQANLSNYTNQWLDIRVAGASLSTLTLGTDSDTGIVPAMVEQFEFVGTNQITNFTNQFANARSLRWIVNHYADNAQNMTSMHNKCYDLQQIPFYNTANVTNFSSMLQECIRLKSVPFLNTSKAVNMSSMFSGCRSLVSVPAFNTSLVTNMASMFANCDVLQTIPWFDTSNVTNMSSMFYLCGTLKKIPYLNTSKATNMSNMFNGCYSLLAVPPIDTSKNTNFFGTFAGLYYVRKLGPIDVSSATSIAYMFAYGGSSLREIEFTKPTTNITNFTAAFFNCWGLTTIKNLDMSNASGNGIAQVFTNYYQPEIFGYTFGGSGSAITDATGMFAYSRHSSFSTNTINIPNATSMSQFLFVNQIIREVPPINAPRCLNMSEAFRGCASLVSIRGLTLPSGACMASFNSAGFNSTFRDCPYLTTIPPIDFSGITTASTHANVYLDMFTGCRSLSGLSGCTGIQHNFSISGCKFGATALNDLYRSLAVVGTSGANAKIITVTSNWGASASLGHDPSIATSKGWQVAG